MHLKRLKITQFKNYEEADLTFSEMLNCFTGLNGVGKTNLLDAIHFLCLCKSHQSLLDGELMRRGSDFFRVEGYFERDERDEKIIVKLAAGKRKIFERNGNTYPKLSEHIGLLPVVMICPDDVALAKEGSEYRRKFLDNTISQYDRGYLNALLTYTKILEQRNALLKSERFSEALLAIYDTQLVEPARIVCEGRAALVAELSVLFNAYYARISGDREAVACRYDSQLLTQNMSDILASRREKDRVLQRTTGGVHRDELTFIIHDVSLKKFGSQGQLKSFVIALKLAQHALLRQHSGMQPILLLDDFFDKLDEQRVTNVLSLLVDMQFGQLFLTDTSSDRIQSVLKHLPQLDTKLWQVENGIISPTLPY